MADQLEPHLDSVQRSVNLVLSTPSSPSSELPSSHHPDSKFLDSSKPKGSVCASESQAQSSSRWADIVRKDSIEARKELKFFPPLDPIPSQLGLAISSSFPVDNGPHSCLLDTSGDLAVEALVAAMEVPHVGTAVECIDDLAVENSTSIGCSYILKMASLQGLPSLVLCPGGGAADEFLILVMPSGLTPAGCLELKWPLGAEMAVGSPGGMMRAFADVPGIVEMTAAFAVAVPRVAILVCCEPERLCWSIHVGCSALPCADAHWFDSAAANFDLLCDSELKHVLVFLIPKALFFYWFACCCSDVGCVAWSCMMLFAGCRSAATDDFADSVADAPGL
ncbi:hypothetical protein Nepgr_022930 [Nepenthes gracilis]|uniref:Uncharacterized protein n=1 Tax=Nepenthes gracilis TaxID=150966 RepID=A0AAD3XXG0_NEPGR|nr:hypothetical protein Nepgr_022930 [Nepenthes gracilis]